MVVYFSNTPHVAEHNSSRYLGVPYPVALSASCCRMCAEAIQLKNFGMMRQTLWFLRCICVFCMMVRKAVIFESPPPWLVRTRLTPYLRPCCSKKLSTISIGEFWSFVKKIHVSLRPRQQSANMSYILKN